MADTKAIDILIDFGLTRQEGTIYSALLNHGEMTGYEVAKDTHHENVCIFGEVLASNDSGIDHNRRNGN